METPRAATAADTGTDGNGRTFAVVKRSVIVGGRKTSVSLEDAFWDSVKEIAQRQDVSLSALIARVHAARSTANLSSAIRLFVLDHFRNRAITHLLIGSRLEPRHPTPLTRRHDPAHLFASD